MSDSEGVDRLSSPHGSNYQQSVLSAVTAGIDMVKNHFLLNNLKLIYICLK